MTAYGAVLSLMNTINNILTCSRFRLIGNGSSQQIIQVVYKELEPWQEILERLDKTSPSRSRKKVNALDGRIKEVIWKFEGSLESLLIQQIPSQLQTLPEIVSIDLQSLKNEVHSLIETLKDMEKDYVYEVENMPQDEPISSSFGFPGTKSKMIGLSDQFEKLKTYLMSRDTWINFQRLIGTAGVGKTTLAMQIYEDPQIQSKFECRAWVTVGRVPRPMSQILRGILAQLCGITQGDEEIEDDKLKERLDGKNCLIVLDDVWEIDAWNCMEHSFSRMRNGCIHFLFIGRHIKMINGNVYIHSWYEVRFLNEEESMELLCEKVFGDEICPPQLHKVAAKIAKHCEGLPLLIITVANMISSSEKNRDPTYWNEVAERRNSVFKDAYDEISKVLFPSYGYLPQNLKMPFLFMGVFPRDYYNPPSKIITMLTTEGLLYRQEVEIRRHQWGNTCLRELAFNYSLLLCSIRGVDKTSSFVLTYKTCRLHSSWRHVCRREASENKFYHVLNTLNDASGESLKGQRGLCVENNILFGIKDFRDSVRLNCASFARSLLFYGPYHQYPIPIDVGFMLLREIDALTQRFYTFPIEILSLVQLKYLALTCNGEVPATISKLFNLRVLIIHPHMKIRRRGAPSNVPIQVWDMQELEHIEILGKSLVAPSHVVSLENLSTLIGVNASICTIFKLSQRIPKIKKLGIQIELTPYEDHNDLLSLFGCISTLKSLETLKLSITNPVIKNGHAFLATHGQLKLPFNLKKLHLSGMGFPWKYMDVIGSLPSLRVLKLRSYAFQGSQWETNVLSFKMLQFLLIEESDLVQWKPGPVSFIDLQYLSMKHCYKLEDICRPSSLDRSNYTVEIELEDCNPLAMTWATQLQPQRHATLRVTCSSSFDEKPTTIKFERYGYDQSESNHSAMEEANVEYITNRGEDDEADIGDGADEENKDEYNYDHDEDIGEEADEENDDEYTYDHDDIGESVDEENDDAYNHEGT